MEQGAAQPPSRPAEPVMRSPHLSSVPEVDGPVDGHPSAPVLPLLAVLREDWITHDRAFLSLGLHAIATHRVAVWRHSQPAVLRRLLTLVYKVVNKVVIRNLYGVEIYETTLIGRRVHLPHHMGVLLGTDSVVGDDCMIRQHVTLGQVGDQPGQPVLGPGVQVGAGAVLMGAIRVGAGAHIGPNAVVMTSVPAGATVMSPPAETMRPAVTSETTTPPRGQSG